MNHNLWRLDPKRRGVVNPLPPKPHKSDASLAASYLGSLAKGKPKRLTEAERKRRGARLAEARKRRWIKPVLTYRN